MIQASHDRSTQLTHAVGVQAYVPLSGLATTGATVACSVCHAARTEQSEIEMSLGAPELIKKSLPSTAHSSQHGAIAL